MRHDRSRGGSISLARTLSYLSFLSYCLQSPAPAVASRYVRTHMIYGIWYITHCVHTHTIYAICYMTLCVHSYDVWYMVKQAPCYICMYICTHANMYLCMHVYMYVLCMHVCTSVYMYVCLYAYMYTWSYVCMYLQTKAHDAPRSIKRG